MTGRQRKVAGLAGIAVVAGVVAVIAIPGGSPGGSESAGPASGVRSVIASAPAHSSILGSLPGSRSNTSAAGSAATSLGATSPVAAKPGAASPASDTSQAASSLAATRVVRTGQLSLVVPVVTTAMQRLTSLATTTGGYVQRSDTTTNGGVPQGDITLRVPAARFEAAVTAAQRLGRTSSLTTSADDVTGRYVDLVARATALRRTRATYLTILSRATTIGATLSVQQRVDDVQQQLDQLEGERKVLASQSSDATLSVSLAQKGHEVPPPTHHVATGIGAAWHRSVHRFSAGIDAIVGVLGPLLLALLLLVVLGGIGLLGYRGVRRLVGPPADPPVSA
jgi:hypothetical protein